MKNKLLYTISLFIIMVLCASPVFALTIDTGNSQKNEQNSSSNTVASSVTTLELVEDKVCNIDLKDPDGDNVIGKFTKKLTNIDTSKKEATLTLTLENILEKEKKSSPIEVYLVLDNSSSMSKTYNGKSKVEYVAENANLFVDSLFDYFENAKMGIVSFTCEQLVTDTPGTFNDGTENDAKLLLPLSDSSDSVKSKIEEYKASTRGQHTNIEAGLAVAEKNFTDNEEAQKYVILLSDGVPNLCLDTENTLQYSGVIATKTKKRLQDMSAKGYHMYSVLMGLNEAEVPAPSAPMNSETGKHMTYRELAEEIFGTKQAPTVGEFYYIDYENLNQTINTDIYQSIVSEKDTSLKNIVIKDYFPKEIIDNFNFTYVKSPNIGKVSEKVDTTDNSITWNIEVLEAGQVATLSYKLTLKDNYNKSIVDKILPTNTKVDIDYNYDNKDGKSTSPDSPTIRVRYSESSKDETITKKPIPQTGFYNTILCIAGISLVAFAITRVYRLRK